MKREAANTEGRSRTGCKQNARLTPRYLINADTNNPTATETCPNIPRCSDDREMDVQLRDPARFSTAAGNQQTIRQRARPFAFLARLGGCGPRTPYSSTSRPVAKTSWRVSSSRTAPDNA
jgi:hypothetical protein